MQITALESFFFFDLLRLELEPEDEEAELISLTLELTFDSSGRTIVAFYAFFFLDLILISFGLTPSVYRNFSICL